MTPHTFDIIGTGALAPERTVKNSELSEYVETSDEWISSRTGISERRVLAGETLTSIAAAAGKRALESAGLDAGRLDLIICSTLQGDYLTPSLSCLVQEALGASCPAFDMNAACSGFLYALDVAAGYFARGAAEHILVVAAEGMSRLIDWADRETCVLFGDGAGAAVLKKGGSLRSSVIGAQGGRDSLYIPASRGKSPFDGTGQEPMFLHMAGKDVFRFAVGAIVKNLEAAAEQAGVSLADIDWIVPHQANVRMLASASNQLDIPIEKFLVNIQKYGNTSSASIPLMLDEAVRDGRLKAGQLVAMVAFGGGLTTGACILKWK